ncbi:MAG: acyl-homoserine-lactone synthase [Alphaproteobacteria bacterium]|nr:acyl-homoserine-lactone synthase [Alphaproteobacteria bacterium]
MSKVDCFNWDSAHFFGDALTAQAKLRYQRFIAELSWDVPSYNGMEFDQYDNPSAYYFVVRDATGKALACMRAAPTTLPYMLEEVFPHMVDGPLPKQDDVWEAHRLAVEPTLRGAARATALNLVNYGLTEFATRMGIKAFVGLLPEDLRKDLEKQVGWTLRPIGKPHLLDGLMTTCISNDIGPQTLSRVGQATGLSGSVLRLAPSDPLNERTAA